VTPAVAGPDSLRDEIPRFKPFAPSRHPIGVHESLALFPPLTRPVRAAEAAPIAGAREQALVQRAQAGERAAFDALYAASVERVYAVCLRLCGDRPKAERLTQDTYVRAWQKLGTFRGDAALTTWLHRIAVNVVLNDGRAEGRRALRVETVADIDAYGAQARAQSTDLRIDLERAIAALPTGARTILVLHDVEGYRHDEIAAMLDIATGTVKAQLHRARRLLREMMDR
jgi:RNA polymerase sigma-70 factor (ECF subfamily)